MKSASSSKTRKSVSIFGILVFLLVILWGLWHGVVGPRVIDPVPDTAAATASE